MFIDICYEGDLMAAAKVSYIVELNDGRLMGFGRLNSESEQKPFNFETPASFSIDGGKTWTHEATEFPAISSVQRQALIRLRQCPQAQRHDLQKPEW